MNVITSMVLRVNRNVMRYLSPSTRLLLCSTNWDVHYVRDNCLGNTVNSVIPRRSLSSKLSNKYYVSVLNVGVSSQSTAFPKQDSKLTLNCVRYKHKKGGKKRQEFSDSSDDEIEDDEDWSDPLLEKDSKIVTAKIGSLRTDLVLKYGLGMARNKVENAFYESKIRVNGQKILKKSKEVHVGDEVDIVRGVSPKNKDFLLVSRVEVLAATPKEDHVLTKLRRFRSLTIENYNDSPWLREEE